MFCTKCGNEDQNATFGDACNERFCSGVYMPELPDDTSSYGKFLALGAIKK